MATSSKKKTSTKKKTSSQKVTAAQRKEAALRKKREYEIKQEVKLVLVCAAALFLFICNFRVAGKVGNFLSDIMFGLFGFLAYIAPLFIAALTLFVHANPGNIAAVYKTASGGFLFFLLQMSIDLISGMSKTADKCQVKEFWLYASTNKKGGGVLATMADFGLLQCIGKVGTILLIVALIFVCVIVLTEKKLFSGVKDTTEKVFEHTKEDLEYKAMLEKERAEELEAKREEKRLEREERRIEREKREAQLEKEREELRKQKEAKEIFKAAENSKPGLGVTSNTTVGPVLPKSAIKPVNDDIHEIKLNGFDPATPENGVTKTPVAGAIEEVMIDDEPAVPVSISKPITTATPVNSVKTKPVARPSANSDVANAPSIAVPAVKPTTGYKFPPLSLLAKGGIGTHGDSAQQIRETAQKLTDTLEIFGVKAKVTDISQGPTVTRFELQPDLGVKVSKIKNLSDDIKLNLAAADIRIEAPIPGKAAIGIEVPNKESQAVLLRDLIESEEFKRCNSNLAFAVGKDIAGKPIVYDIDKFPHILIAGATGSGKSVCINTLIMSVIYKAHPDDVKFIMIDPKVVELSVYNGIPHLVLPVVTDAKKAAATLNYAVNEMMERYKKFADLNVREISAYNSAVAQRNDDSELYKKLPHIVIIVDEFADLIMTAKNEVEEAIVHLAQLARAAGIHLILATQRPSADVITGLIKANMPSRLAFAVSSQIESRIILDMSGAEELLGKGDMLFFPKGLKKPVRLQGGFVSDAEVNKVVDFLKEQGSNSYDSEALEKIDSIQNSSSGGASSDGGSAEGNDDMFIEVGRFVIESQKASIGWIQRKFQMGFNRAARIMDQLAEAGVVSDNEGTKARTILMSMSDFESYIEANGL